MSLSPDDQGFWDAKGATLDFCYAFLAWGLDLADLKKLIMNSLEYASIGENDKAQIRNFAEYKWRKFLLFVKGRH